MKFYKDKNNEYYYWDKIINNNLTAVYVNKNKSIRFFKNGKLHNSKNTAYVHKDGYKIFYLNSKLYGDKDNFTKQTWRRFIKLQALL
jgi:hypothetical protein